MKTKPLDQFQAKFGGFRQEAFAFLRELGRHNNKPWFDAHKQEFKTLVEAPAHAFAAEVCRCLSATYSDIPRINAKVFRIYRDVRFSHDKSPYKTHVGIRFCEDVSRGCAAPFFYVHLDARKLMLVVGIKEFDTPTRARFRDAVLDNEKGNKLGNIVAELKKGGLAVTGEMSAKVPRGFPPDHERANLLCYDGLYAESTQGIPTLVHSHEFPAYCVGRFGTAKKLYDWMKLLCAQQGR